MHIRHLPDGSINSGHAEAHYLPSQYGVSAGHAVHLRLSAFQCGIFSFILTHVVQVLSTPTTGAESGQLATQVPSNMNGFSGSRSAHILQTIPSATPRRHEETHLCPSQYGPLSPAFSQRVQTVSTIFGAVAGHLSTHFFATGSQSDPPSDGMHCLHCRVLSSQTGYYVLASAQVVQVPPL